LKDDAPHPKWALLQKHGIEFECTNTPYLKKKIAINLRSLVSVLDYSYIVVPGN
jgi:hypothetical protein